MPEPPAPGADPAGPARAEGDPREGATGPAGGETAPAEPFLFEMTRLFIIPAVVVILCVAVFVLFGLIASEGKSARDYLGEIRQGTSSRRWQAAFELSRILTQDPAARSDRGLGSEISAALSDPKIDDPQVRRFLLMALEEIADPETAPAVQRALQDPDQEVRLFAVRALGRIGGTGSAAALTPLLQDQDPGLRKMALHSLGRLGDARAAEAIRPRLDDPVEDVRWNAALALAVLGDASGAGILRRMMDPAYLDRVQEISEAQKIGARINAIQAAYRLHHSELRAVVEGLSRSDPSLKVRDVALKAIADWR